MEKTLGVDQRLVRYQQIGLFSTALEQMVTVEGYVGRKKIHFGAGGTTSNGEISVSSEGVITFNTGGYFRIALNVVMEGDNSILVGRAMLEVGGVAAQYRGAFAEQSPALGSRERELFIFNIQAIAGMKLWFEMAVMETTPPGVPAGIGGLTLTGTLASWNPVPSAEIEIGRFFA